MNRIVKDGENMIDVLCIGHSAYDVTLPLKEFPIENLKYSIKSKIEGGGGPAANAAYLLSKWGVPTSYIGVLGDDLYGEKIIKEFISVGTDISMVKKEEGRSTPYSIILVNTKNGSRTIINYKDIYSNLDIPSSQLKSLNPKVILFDGHELDTSINALKLFPDAKTILDAGSVREGTIKLAKEVDYLIASENFALTYCEMDSLETEEDYNKCINRMKELNKNHIIVTLGERGLIYRDKDRVKKLDSYKAKKVVDTTGAGDIFHGAFAYGLIKDYSLLENLKFSSMTSAISVESLGGRQSIPELKDVLDKIKDLG